MNKDNVLNNLFNIIEDRKDKPIEGSYTGYLFEKGLDKILKKSRRREFRGNYSG